jgi:type IV secretory pathway VirB10-like protein
MNRISCLAAVSAVALTVGFTVPPSLAQVVVFDPNNYAQNVLTAARALQQINNQITSLQNQTQMLINQAKNLASLPFSSLQQLQSSIQRTQQLLTQAQRIAYDVQQIDRAFTTTYAPASAGTTSQALTSNAQARWQTSVAARTTSPDRVAAPASTYVVQAGNIIPAALITGIRSDLPGQITAQVTENVFDSPTGRFLLVPQGTRLIGIYDSQVAFGQSRVLLVWTRLIMPNGRSIVLERQPGADTAGYAGLEDEVDNHWGALFKAALLSTLLGVGSELGSTTATGTNSDVITALRRGSSDSLNQTGQKVVQQNLNIQPTLTIRPGFPVRVIVNRDLVLEPYKA